MDTQKKEKDVDKIPVPSDTMFTNGIRAIGKHGVLALPKLQLKHCRTAVHGGKGTTVYTIIHYNTKNYTINNAPPPPAIF
jgi:hypothetical protein